FVVLLYACYLSSRSGPVILLTTPSCTLFPYLNSIRLILTRNKMNYTVKQVVAILVSLTRSFIKAYTYIFKDLKATQKRLSSFNQTGSVYITGNNVVAVGQHVGIEIQFTFIDNVNSLIYQGVGCRNPYIILK